MMERDSLSDGASASAVPYGQGTGVYLPDVIGAGYGEFWRCKKRYRVVKGGKASKKSSTTALWYIYHLMRFSDANLLVVRKVGDGHRSSTFAQLQWAIQRLHAERWWKATKSPLELTYLPTGQKILFRGMDDPLKIAGVTVATGYLCWVWIEEAYEIESEDAFDKLDLSAPRGAIPEPLFKQTTLTFNPWNENHWLKKRFFDHPPENALVMTTNYLCNEFLDDTDRANYERMKREQPRKYDVAGLGNWGVSEGLVLENWTVEGFDIRAVTKEKPWQFRHIFGLDYGYTNDPTAFIAAAVNPLRRELYVYDEHYEQRMLNTDIAAMLIRKGYPKERIRADSAEPKSNDDLKRLGIHRIIPAEKGRDSILHGIAALQEYKIIIHPLCKHTATEIASYCWRQDKTGKTLNEPVDTANHLMDALRYAMADATGFRPPEQEPKRVRPRGDGLTAEDMKGALLLVGSNSTKCEKSLIL